MPKKIYVGVDIGKFRHECCIVDSDVAVVRSSFPFDNSKKGFESFDGEIGGIADSEVAMIGFETTGHVFTGRTRLKSEERQTLFAQRQFSIPLTRESVVIETFYCPPPSESRITMPVFLAWTASSILLRYPVLRSKEATWFLTVLTEITSLSAISSFV